MRVVGLLARDLLHREGARVTLAGRPDDGEEIGFDATFTYVIDERLAVERDVDAVVFGVELNAPGQLGRDKLTADFTTGGNLGEDGCKEVSA